VDVQPLEEWMSKEARALQLKVDQAGNQLVAEYQLPNGEVLIGSGSLREDAIGTAYVKAGGPRDPKYGFRLIGREPLMCYRCGGTRFERYTSESDVSELELRRVEAGLQWREPLSASSENTIWAPAHGKVLCVWCRGGGRIAPAGLLVYELKDGERSTKSEGAWVCGVVRDARD